MAIASASRRRFHREGILALLLVFALPLAATGQSTRTALGTGAHFQSYSLGEALGAEVANLTLLPLAFTLPVGNRFDLDLYGAYANGSVEKGGYSYTLQGLVDTQVRARFQASPWAVLTALVNIPTGNSLRQAVNLEVEPRLANTAKFGSGASTKHWYLFAAPSFAPMIVAFLNSSSL